MIGEWDSSNENGVNFTFTLNHGFTFRLGFDVNVGCNGGSIPLSDIPSLIAWLQGHTDRELTAWAAQIQAQADEDAEMDRFLADCARSENKALQAEVEELRAELAALREENKK